jgi:hypothetical protein
MTHALSYLLAGNAGVAFLTFFCLQAAVIIKLRSISTPQRGFETGMGDPNSLSANFHKFFKGDLFPRLHHAWSYAIWYCGLSFALVLGVVPFLEK